MMEKLHGQPLKRRDFNRGILSPKDCRGRQPFGSIKPHKEATRPWQEKSTLLHSLASSWGSCLTGSTVKVQSGHFGLRGILSTAATFLPTLLLTLASGGKLVSDEALRDRPQSSATQAGR